VEIFFEKINKENYHYQHPAFVTLKRNFCSLDKRLIGPEQGMPEIKHSLLTNFDLQVGKLFEEQIPLSGKMNCTNVLCGFLVILYSLFAHSIS
jgi:hypothetical protein